MNIEQKRIELEKRIREAQYPQRANARFTDENDHNPLILQDCPKCKGSGRFCEHYSREDGAEVRALKICSDCGGTGTTGQVERYFLADTPETTAVVSPNGWVTCPKCGVRFTLRDRHRWTGRRHLTCGQKIRLVTETSQPDE